MAFKLGMSQLRLRPGDVLSAILALDHHDCPGYYGHDDGVEQNDEGKYAREHTSCLKVCSVTETLIRYLI